MNAGDRRKGLQSRLFRMKHLTTSLVTAFVPTL